MMNRRSLLLGIGAALAAPAIVRAESLMKVAQLRARTSGWEATPANGVEIHGIDDYEEGPWSPIVNGVRYEAAGRYVRVGNMVTFSSSFEVAGGYTEITGLPFHRAA